MKGYGIVSATSVVVGEYEQSRDVRYAEVRFGEAWYAKKSGRAGRDTFTDRAACVAAVNAKLAKKRASLRKQLAALDALTGEQLVAAAETKAKVDA
jgi:hypothetical protein